MAIEQPVGGTPGGQEESPSGGGADPEGGAQRGAVKGEYDWATFEREHHEGEGRFDPGEYLGFEPEDIRSVLAGASTVADEAGDLVEVRTVNVSYDDEDTFFTTVDGATTIANRYDLERAVPLEKKRHFREESRYWVNKPYSFVVVFHSEKENEKKYYAIEPHLTPIEVDLREFLAGKLKTAIKYASEDVVISSDDGDGDVRGEVIELETHNLLERYDLYAEGAEIREDEGVFAKLKDLLGMESARPERTEEISGLAVRPEPAIMEEDPETLSEYQVRKLLYLLKRDFIGYERIDAIKHDINVEDISCDGYNSPVFVYHTDYEQLISNIYHGEQELDDFVVKLAQRSGKGISKRQPQVDATLPDGSRAQLTLGREVSDHGTNYTIRQFKEIPFTPVDLINWQTFSLDEMAFLWLCIENNKSLIFAGGTASGKTTSLNAVSLFIPSKSKIVSIEDTREVELPQRNWIASVTRPSFTGDDTGDIDEFDLLEAALRQRPEYIVMGEIRGEEGRTLFQVMSTGHTSMTTFHADSVGEVIKRFTTDPINVSKTMFTALDLVSIQTQTRVQGRKVRRTKSVTEINHYDPENDEINVQDVYQWQAESDEFIQMGDSNTLESIMFDRGWTAQQLNRELFQRKVVLAYLIEHGLNTYTQVAATIQAFINDPESILTLMANEKLERSLEDLREMESVQIDIDPEKEEMVPRPDPDEDRLAEVRGVLEEADDMLAEYRGHVADLEGALDIPVAEDISAAADGGADDSASAGLSDQTGDGGALTSGETGEDSPEDFDYGGFSFNTGEPGASEEADGAAGSLGGEGSVGGEGSAGGAGGGGADGGEGSAGGGGADGGEGSAGGASGGDGGGGSGGGGGAAGGGGADSGAGGGGAKGDEETGGPAGGSDGESGGA